MHHHHISHYNQFLQYNFHHSQNFLLDHCHYIRHTHPQQLSHYTDLSNLLQRHHHINQSKQHSCHHNQNFREYSHEPSSVFAVSSKLHAESSVHPKTSINGKLTCKASPETSENIKFDIQPSVTSPSKTTKVPSPAGTTEPVNENAKLLNH